MLQDSLTQAIRFQISAALKLKHVCTMHSFHRPSGQTGQEVLIVVVLGSEVNICLREEISGPWSELPVICLHSCVISKVM